MRSDQFDRFLIWKPAPLSFSSLVKLFPELPDEFMHSFIVPSLNENVVDLVHRARNMYSKQPYYWPPRLLQLACRCRSILHAGCFFRWFAVQVYWFEFSRARKFVIHPFHNILCRESASYRYTHKVYSQKVLGHSITHSVYLST